MCKTFAKVVRFFNSYKKISKNMRIKKQNIPKYVCMYIVGDSAKNTYYGFSPYWMATTHMFAYTLAPRLCYLSDI